MSWKILRGEYDKDPVHSLGQFLLIQRLWAKIKLLTPDPICGTHRRKELLCHCPEFWSLLEGYPGGQHL
ncbi:hypothetical protein GDO81_000687 [Engystomops pustulosus]|uniref:Uncharacterized protein n=1 Tax=Engystomops pustulosus TaxID=76066 RepID=A0AAV7D9S0_ENGPU|nr:hypothetical protein GDO81_000687 [Engystomops pustulosus]